MAETRMLAGHVWTRQDSGAWTSKFGAVARESRNVWFAFPIDDAESSRGGPFKTLLLAAESLSLPDFEVFRG